MSEQGKNPGNKIDQLLNDVGRLSESTGTSAEKSHNGDAANIKGADDKPAKKEVAKPKNESNKKAEVYPNPVYDEDALATEKTKSKKGWYIAGTIVLILAVLAGVYAFLSKPLTDAQKEKIYANGTFVDGISVFDVDVSGDTIASARQKLSGKVDFTGDKVLLELKLKDAVIPVKAADLQVDNTVDSVLKEAILYGREGNFIKRLIDKNNAKNNGKSFDVAIYTDDTSLQNLVNSIVTNYSVEPKDADVQLNSSGEEKFTFIPAQVGMQISTEGLAEKIKSHIEGNASGYVELNYTEIQPTITEEKLKENMVLRSTYSTNVSGATGRRKNIILAASKINAKKVMPGEEFNIEGELGPRTKEKGWNVGGEFVNGELVNGYGGGICQVSTTLFNAVIRGDLEVIKRSNHSQTVGYVPLGFDATISSGGPYFIWKNNTNYPIFIFASASMSKITVELYGAPLKYGNNITYEEVVSASGTVTSGRNVQSALVFYSDGKEVHRISWSSSYRGKPVKVTTKKSTVAPATEKATTATEKKQESSVQTKATNAAGNNNDNKNNNSGGNSKNDSNANKNNNTNKNSSKSNKSN